MLKTDLAPGEAVEIGAGEHCVVVRFEQKSGQATRVVVDGPREIPVRIVRHEGKQPTSLARLGLSKA